MAAVLGKKPTACVPCHERKVRCDSTAVGIPCTRCITKGRGESCTLLERGGGRNAHKRRRTTTDADEVLSPQRRERELAVDQFQQTLPTRTEDQNQDGDGDGYENNDDDVFPAARPPLTPATSVRPLHQDPTFTQTDVANGLLELSHAGHHPAAPIQYMVSEDDAHLQTLGRMSDEDRAMPSLVPLSSGSEQGQQVIEYYGEFNSVTVLSEVLGQSQRRLIGVDLPGPTAVGALQREFSRLDETDIAYLRGKRVHDFPSTNVCRAFLHLFFKHVHPYTPVVIRQQLLEDYERGSCPSFLLWSIFANAAPYGSSELLLEAGYTEYSTAQKDFFTKARLLYDFGCEKGQLNLLQGSVLLSSFQNSFAPDKDFRFWFHNAVRIATQMGFHRRDIGKHLDPTTFRLVRRIWWVIYCRDVWFSLVGFENARRIQEDGLDMPLLEMGDWAPDLSVAPQYRDIIPDITPLQQHFLIENCRLGLLGARFLTLLGPNQPPPTLAVAHEFVNTLRDWRTSFPEELLLDRISHWTDMNAWVLFLWAMGYRLECSFYRTLRQRTKGPDAESASWANERLRRCIFELDTVLKRAVFNDVARFCPPSLIICASHLLALQLEIALDSSAPDPQRLAAKTQMHTGLAYIRGVGARWLNAKWTYRVFDSVTKRMGLAMGDEELPGRQCSNGNDNAKTAWGQSGSSSSQVGGSGSGSVFDAPVDLAPVQGGEELGLPDRWIESLLTENLMNGVDDGLFNLLVP